MSLANGLAALYYTWRRTPTLAASRESIYTATLFGILYYVTGLSAILYPGTRWVDPEFGEGKGPVPIFVGFGSMALLGGWLELRRLGGV